jgi:hypothetical protein
LGLAKYGVGVLLEINTAINQIELFVQLQAYLFDALMLHLPLK